MSATQIYCEPFVYGSLQTKFGTGYHLLARGKKLGHEGEVLKDLLDIMLNLAQAGERAGGLLTYQTLGGPDGLGMLLKCTPHHDWAGRPGVFCSALVMRLRDVAELPGASVLALDIPSLPFLSPDQVKRFIADVGDKSRSALQLEGINLKANPAFLRDGDRAQLVAQLPVWVRAARTLAVSGQTLHTSGQSDHWRQLRLTNLCTPAAQRPALTFALDLRSGVSVNARLVWWAGTPDSGLLNRGLPLIDESPASREDAPALTYLRGRLEDTALPDGELVERLSPPQVAAKDPAAYWAAVEERERKLSLAEAPTLGAASAEDMAAALADYIRRSPERATSQLPARFAGWFQAENAALTDLLRSARSARDQILWPALVAAARTLLASPDPVFKLPALCTQDTVVRVREMSRLFAEAAAGQRLAPPDIDAVLGLRPDAAVAWLEILLPRQVGVFLSDEAFRTGLQSGRWTLSAEAWALLLQACLQGDDAQNRKLVLEAPGLRAALEPAQLTAFGAGELTEIAPRLVAAWNTQGAAALWAGYTATREKHVPVATLCIEALANLLGDLDEPARLEVIVRVREWSAENSLLRARAAQSISRIRDPRAAQAARRALDGSGAPPPPASSASAEVMSDALGRGSRKRGSAGPKKAAWAIAAAVVVAAAAAGGWFYFAGRGALPANGELADHELERLEKS